MKHQASDRPNEDNRAEDALDKAEFARLRATNKRLERLVGLIDGLDPAEPEPSGQPSGGSPT